MRLCNSKGSIFYGMHFVPGVAEYRPAGKDAFRVFVNEDTIRKMGPTFAGKPVFVHHVDGDEIPDSVDDLREDADGWVVESFFNEADGKHWCKFIVVTEKALNAITQGFRLSNCYGATEVGRGGRWNGVAYEKEVKDGEYEHLALVPDPRYEESVILTPEEFKAYNASKSIELTRLANTKEENSMKVSFFKRAKIENAKDLNIEELMVALPKSKRELTVLQLVNEADAAEEAKKAPKIASDDMMVKVGETEMTVAELVRKYNEALGELTKPVENEDDDDMVENEDDDTVENEDDEVVENEDDDKEEKEERTANAKDAPAPAAKAAAKKKADELRTANSRGIRQERIVLQNGVSVGQSRYGSK